MKERSQGFTMVELIVVIAILGILAAIAIPRYITQTSNARTAAISGLSGALASANALAQTEYAAKGDNTATSIDMNGTTVMVTAGAGKGHPVADSTNGANGIAKALQTLQGFTPAYSGTAGSGLATFTITGYSGADCEVTYADSTGEVNKTTSGC